MELGDLVPARNLPPCVLSPGVQRQAAAVGVLLRFFGLGVLAFDVGERHFQRLVTESDRDGVC